MKWPEIADLLAQLGNPTRLAVFRTVLRAGLPGMPVGAVQSALGLAPSTLAFHLRGLAEVGLLRQRKVGRQVICTGNLALLEATFARVRDECCRDLPEPMTQQKQRQHSGKPGNDGRNQGRRQTPALGQNGKRERRE